MNEAPKKFKRHTITSALPYANGPKHIGHLAGAYLPADIYVRYLRQMGEEVLFVCGSDEHGAAITIQALQENTTPRAIIDKYHVLVRDSFEKLGISFDVYHRTSEPLHYETAQEFFRNMHSRGLLKVQTSEQYYDEEARLFLADRYIKGTCPNCQNPSAFGDQCEKCGTDLSPEELINPRSTLSGNAPVMRETSHWYLPLDQYEGWLRQWILEGHRDDWKANVYGQCKSWIEAGLHARAVTRDLDWGVPVPLEGAAGKVLYVWFDAPIGYISATKQWALDHGQDWEKWWKDPETRLVHFVGKDNIVFHCIIFPVMLHAHGGYILPENVPANEFMNLEGDKMSTSRRWSVEMHEYIEDFPDKPDVLRYCLIANLPESKDSEFTWDDFRDRNNNELVATLGNLVNRVVVMIRNNHEGKIPAGTPNAALMVQVEEAAREIGRSIELYRFKEALLKMMDVARMANKVLSDNEPWKMYKNGQTDAAAAVVLDALHVVASLAILTEPFMPFTSQKICDMLRMDPALIRWAHAGRSDLIQAGQEIGEAGFLFTKFDEKALEPQKQKLYAARDAYQAMLAQQAAAEAPPAPPVTPARDAISFDDFSKLDLRIGTVLEAGIVEGADKLLKLRVDTGLDVRTIVSGIRLHFSPEDMVGKQVLVLANLAPRKIRGIESQGMLLFAEDLQGKLHGMGPWDQVPPGSTVG